ncbi:YbgC/FadM family acyl-CoA thioesterase [Gammaproteobacteria bacterium]|jgi:acyl-CoA thioester hydrolase|nr:YbgC/FadM family acyl-CoA thioesterase [Gammaproteobacteria bacterium]MDC1150432.1 YbgC/FadM family acyl-CoA thioesterase [Gammaproteobacteria bacterium]
MSKIFKHKDFELTIFVEDTDFQGFVYHANYIKYFERARSNFLTINGISQNDLRQSNLGFVIKRIDVDFLYPAKLGEKLVVQTEVEKKSKARMLFNQKIISHDKKNQICKGSVEVCLVDIETKKPKPFPNDLLLIFNNGEPHG